MEDYTSQEIITFEDEDGLDIEMEVVDEFDYEDKHYMALRPSLQEVMDAEDEDEIVFFRVYQQDGEELFDLVEDKQTITHLGDILENRLLNS